MVLRGITSLELPGVMCHDEDACNTHNDCDATNNRGRSVRTVTLINRVGLVWSGGVSGQKLNCPSFKGYWLAY